MYLELFCVLFNGRGYVIKHILNDIGLFLLAYNQSQGRDQTFAPKSHIIQYLYTLR